MEIEDEEAADAFVSKDIYIRKSSLDLFHILNVPKNQIVCEFKNLSYGRQAQTPYLLPVFEWVLINKEQFSLPVVGIDRVFQNDLLGETRHHYMSIQILASFLSNWFFLCIGGSSNLMSVLPIKALLLTDKFINFNASALNILRLHSEKRLGELGKQIPILRPAANLANKVDMISSINQAIEVLSTQEVEITPF